MQEGEYECLKLGAFSPNRNWFIFVESGKSCFPIAFLVQEVETFFRRDREKVNGLEIRKMVEEAKIQVQTLCAWFRCDVVR